MDGFPGGYPVVVNEVNGLGPMVWHSRASGQAFCRRGQLSEDVIVCCWGKGLAKDDGAGYSARCQCLLQCLTELVTTLNECLF